MKNYVLVALLALMLSSCSTMQPPRYAVSVDNIQKLKTYENAEAKVTIIDQSATFDSNCRLMGPIEPADGLSVSQFISKAFNDEFKMADVYSDNGVELNGDLTKISFSSMEAMINGYWDLELDLKSSNGKSISVANKYSFKSGFDAITACNATADALSPAVQDLIKAAVNHPHFETLFK